jgi:ribonuclease D
MNVPPNELVGNAALMDLARARPTDIEALKRVRGAMPRHQGYAVGRELIKAIAAGIADGHVPEGDLPWLERPRLPPEIAKARKARESRLLAWRKVTAVARRVNEQVVLPGHCLKDAAELDVIDAGHLAAVAGIGAFRVARDGADILAALALPPEPKAEPTPAGKV